MLSMLKYITSILFLLLTLPAFAQDEDSTEAPKINVDSFHQFRVGIDISKPIINAFIKDRQAYEFEFDYYHKKELYFVAEGGWGSADVTDSAQQLVYNTTNTFFKAGVNKAMLSRISNKDWDMAFIGLRYGMALIQRSAATYTTYDNFWGSTIGTVPAKSYSAHWFEITGGVKVELFEGIFTGWNVRARFMLNRKSFSELPPSYIAGYGRGDKGSIFDFNFYLNYAIRWRKYKTPTPVAALPTTAPTGEAPANINRPSDTHTDGKGGRFDKPENTGKKPAIGEKTK
jgi:hypothetical protein